MTVVQRLCYNPPVMTSPTQDMPDKDRKQYLFNLTLATVAGQVGCLTTAIVLVTLLLGLWLDSHFRTRPTFTIVMIAGSVPFTIIAMLWVVRRTTAKIKPIQERKILPSQEDTDHGTNDEET
ncbi:MAG: AtpZ/AtpI family protein [Chloroflexota bacterium]